MEPQYTIGDQLNTFLHWLFSPSLLNLSIPLPLFPEITFQNKLAIHELLILALLSGRNPGNDTGIKDIASLLQIQSNICHILSF